MIRVLIVVDEDDVTHGVFLERPDDGNGHVIYKDTDQYVWSECKMLHDDILLQESTKEWAIYRAELEDYGQYDQSVPKWAQDSIEAHPRAHDLTSWLALSNESCNT